MKPIIMKFGGTSVENAPAFKNAARIVSDRRARRPVVVVSAMAGFTDALLGSIENALAVGAEAGVAKSMRGLEKHFDRHRSVIETLLRQSAPAMHALLDQSCAEILELLNKLAREVGHRKTAEAHKRRRFLTDSLVSYGEQLSAAMFSAVLIEHKVVSRNVDARQCIITDDEHGCAAPLMDETSRNTQKQLRSLIESSCVPVLGGFIGSTVNGATTTLGRGGSDYTAALIGAALRAKEIQIWTDVPGVLTADPRLVRDACTVPHLSFEEAAELAYFGAKVLHPKTLHPAIEMDIPVRICNSRALESGSTLVVGETKKSPQTVKAIAHKMGVTTVQVTSTRMLGAYGFLHALFRIFAKHKTAVDVVTTSEVSVSLSLNDTTSLPAIVAELEKLGTVAVEENRAIVCVVGEGLRSTPGIAARIFSTISHINVSLISQGASRMNLTFAVDESCAEETVNQLHREFFEGSARDGALPEFSDLSLEVQRDEELVAV